MSKKWSVCVVCAVLGLLLLYTGLMVSIDPYFQYHKPLNGVSYMFGDDSSVNAGIVRTFDYDTIITGTSLASNFLCSDADELFSAKSVKIIYRDGKPADFKALFDIETDKTLKNVLWSIDPSFIYAGVDAHRVTPHPDYLYDSSILNDYPYWLNKDAFKLNAMILLRTAAGKPAETMDEYTYWGDLFTFSKDKALRSYARPEVSPQKPANAFMEAAEQHFSKNIEPALANHPDTAFYLFAPPCSILYWDSCNRKGDLEAVLNAYFSLLRKTLSYPNVRLSFFANEDYITELNQYTDFIHFNPSLNRPLLEQIQSGSREVNLETLDAVEQAFTSFLTGYDYNGIWQ